MPLTRATYRSRVHAPVLEPANLLHTARRSAPCVGHRRSQRPCCTTLATPTPGAKLGAIRGGLLRSCMDGEGHESLPFQDVWTAVDVHGHRLEIYGSGGWVFESPRAR